MDETRDAAGLPKSEMNRFVDRTGSSYAADPISLRELVRLLGAVLRKAAVALDVPHADYGYDFLGLSREIIREAQGGKLPADLYRLVWRIHATLAPR